MKQNSRLNHDEAHLQGQSETTAHSHQQSSSQGAADFASPEALLRHDAAATPVPPQVCDRLRASLAADPVKTAAWWRRLLGR